MAFACGAGQTPPTQGYDSGPLQFGACPPDLPAAALGECALVEVPLDWNEPDDSRRIAVFVRRFRSGDSAGSANQAWALDGGPGFAGDVFTDPAVRAVFAQAGYDLYIPTHRGTAYGAGLACPDQQAPASADGGRVTVEEFPRCVSALRAQWGDDLTFFDSDSAARDVRHLMERTRGTQPARVVVYGGSYGSYWGQRLLQVAPDSIDGVWLDSIVDLEASFERADENANDAGLRLLEACMARDACAAHFADRTSLGTTASRVAAAYADGDGCGRDEGAGVRGAAVKALFHRLLSGPPWEQALVAPLLRRADRCTGDDARAIAHAVGVLQAPPDAPAGRPPAYNPLLNRHIMLAELFEHGRSVADIERQSRSLLFSTGGDSLMAGIASAYGPEHRRALSADTPDTGAHLVLWQGGIDPLDRVEWAPRTAQRWAPARVSLVELPFAGHSVVRYAVDESGTRCAMEMLRGFLADPGAELDRSCLARIAPFDFAATTEPTEEAALRWFGTPDAWGEDAAP